MKNVQRAGFTIVELLIVIVVIAILAAITIVSYTGIRQRTIESGVKSELSSYSKTLENARTSSGTNTFPSSLSAAGITLPAQKSGQYTYYVSTNNTIYCIEATGADKPYIVSSEKTTPSRGQCGDIAHAVAWWPFNGNARDISGNQIDGQAVNTVLTTGYYDEPDSAYQFNGSNAAIGCGTEALMRPVATASFGIGAMIYITSYPASTTGIVTNGGSTGWALLLDNAGRLQARYGNKLTNSGNAIPLNTWVHARMTYEPTNGNAGYRLYTYFDAAGQPGGSSGTSSTSSPAVVSYDATACSIGSSRNVAGTYFNGKIDDVRFFDTSQCYPTGTDKSCFSSGF